MSSGIPDLLLNLGRQEILLSPGNRSGVVLLLHRRASRGRIKSKGEMTEDDLYDYSPAEDRIALPVLFDATLNRIDDQEGMELRARFYLNVFEAERAFNRNLQRIADLMASHKAIGRRDVRDQFHPTARTTLIEAASILLVTGLENFLRDAFLAYRHLWFTHLPNGPSRNEAALAASRRLSLHDRLSDYVLARPGSNPREALVDELASSSAHGIGFQALSGDRGASWAYKTFLDVNLQDLPDIKKSSAKILERAPTDDQKTA